MSALPVTNQIPDQTTKVVKTFETFPAAYVERALLVVAIIFAIISLVPSLGTIGSLSVRSVAVLAASVQCIEAWKREGAKGLILQVIRLSAVILGLTGVATKINLLVLAALSTDIALHMLESANGLQKKDVYKALTHLTIIIIDGFVMAGILTNMWPFIMTAAIISAFILTLIFLIKAINEFNNNSDSNTLKILDICSYIALSLLNIASGGRSAELIERERTTCYFDYTNTRDVAVTIYDGHGNVIAIVQPNEEVAFSLDPGNTASNARFDNGAIGVFDGKKFYIYPEFYDITTTVLQAPMTAQDFPTLPIDSLSVITKNP